MRAGAGATWYSEKMWPSADGTLWMVVSIPGMSGILPVKGSRIAARPARRASASCTGVLNAEVMAASTGSAFLIYSAS